MAFCPYCGREVSPAAVACPNCGHPLKQVPPVVETTESISAWWWLVPFFFAFLGGLYTYLVLRDRNGKTATDMLVFSIIWTFVGSFILIILVDVATKVSGL